MASQMSDRIVELLQEIENLKAKREQEIEEFRVKYLGKKGEVTKLFEEFRNVLPEQKKEFGRKLNELKNAAAAKIEELKNTLAESNEATECSFDLTKPGDVRELGTRHPISITREEIISIFNKLGYSLAEGPEIEDDYHVFEALNFPPDHPARDMQDTFFISSGNNPILLRTHTSSVQVRTMERQKPPIRVICPGRVFRNEAISARAHCIFHQVEGLYIDKGVSFADLKQAILLFVKEMFGESTQIRMRPSYFPFTEPSTEIDISCNICGGKGCNICKGTGWLEIMGAGMVDPNVLRASGIDPEVYSGFAFGMGVLSAVLAGACVAPVLISVLLLTTDLVAKGQRLALFLPFVMGLGMALPWPFVGAGLQVLPKPGVWMKYVNRVFGVIVLGFACWYGWLAWQGVRGRADGANPTSGQESASSLLKATPATLAVQLSALDARSARPILVDCWATWCKSCSAMDRVMEDGRVKKALAPYTVLRVQAEDISELRKVKGFETIRGLPPFVVFE